LRSGEAYDEVTENALQQASAVVVLWSPRSVVSRWVRAEATTADRNKTLLPAMIETCNLPVMFQLTQTAELSHWRGEEQDPAWRVFLGDVRRMVRRDAPVPPGTAPVPATSASSFGMPIVAVLPLQCRGNGEDLEFLGEDLTEDVTRALGQSFYCKVVAAGTMAGWRGRAADHRALERELGARYVVEGRLQRAGENVRVTVQLIDIGSDSMLWTSRFVRKIADIEESEEELALSIAIELDQTIGKFEIAKAQAKRSQCSAWEYLLRAHGFVGVAAPGRARKTVEEVRKAISVEPDYGVAYAALADALTSYVMVDRLTIKEFEHLEIIGEVREAIKRAIELDGNNPLVLARLALTYCKLGDTETGLRLAQRAATLAPHAAEALYTLGFANFMSGRTSEAIDAIKEQERIGIAHNFRVGTQSTLGICLFIEGRIEEAEEAIDKSLEIQPNYYLSLRWKAVIAAARGKQQSARAAVKLLREFDTRNSVEDYLDSLKHLPIEHPRKYEAIEILRSLLEETEGSA
jgi:TolB-like protein